LEKKKVHVEPGLLDLAGAKIRQKVPPIRSQSRNSFKEDEERGQGRLKRGRRLDSRREKAKLPFAAATKKAKATIVA